MTPLMAWRASVEACHSASELALRLRSLDAAIQWDAIKCALPLSWRSCSSATLQHSLLAGTACLCQHSGAGKAPAQPSSGTCALGSNGVNPHIWLR